MLTEGVDHGGKLHYGLSTEVVSYATTLLFVKVKITFNESQKHFKKEINCLYGLIKIVTSNHISKLLEMQLEFRSRNVHTSGTRGGFILIHAVTMQKSTRGSHIGKPHICVCLQLVSSNHCYIIVLVFGSSSTYSPHINHSSQDSLPKILFWSSNILVRT